MAAASARQRHCTVVPRARGFQQRAHAPDPAGRYGRKLMIALWCFVTGGPVPSGAVLKT
jgi:hypothetical protein